MTLERFRPAVNRAMRPFVRASKALGLTPDGVSTISFVVAGLAGGAFYLGGADGWSRWWYVAGSVLVFVNGWLDLLDGELARDLEVASPAGDLLDHVFDRYADILIVTGLAAGVGRYGVGFAAVTGVLMTSYLGTQAQAVGLDRVYGGMLGRADRLMLVGVVGVAAAVIPDPVFGLTVVGWLLVLFALVGHVTAFQRFYYARRALG